MSGEDARGPAALSRSARSRLEAHIGGHADGASTPPRPARFASKQGLGFLIINAMSLVQTEEMMTIAILLFAFAAAANALLL